MSDKKLFSEFTSPTRQDWLDKIQVDLKGADFQKKLVWKTDEGFSVQPFYMKDDLEKLSTLGSEPGEFPYVRGNKAGDNNWFVRQEICGESAAQANVKALDILGKGVDSLGFKIPAEQISAEYVQTLLNGIYCDCVELNFKVCSKHALELAQILVAYFAGKGYDPARIKASIDFDPIKGMIMNGKDTESLISTGKALIDTVKDYPDFKVISVNGSALSDSGAYIVQELGYSLAWGAEYMKRLADEGVAGGEIARRIKFNMGISTNYFMEIAKFRAARLLWSKIVEEYAGNDKEACKACIHAKTSYYNMTLFDSYVNLLRSQTETMSAAIAGVNSITVTPFDTAYKNPDDFSERIARNQQLLLKEESHFDKVVDPAGGSYYIEVLTDSLAAEAWKIFLKVQEEGGMVEYAKKGLVQDDVIASDTKRHTLAAQSREFILGTNQFPNFTEVSNGKAPMACCCKCANEEAPFKGISTSRLSSEFEALRLSTEKAAKQPVAFMLTIGSLVWRQARAQFSCNFLASAGYKVVDNLGFASVEEGVDAAMKAGADIVVICSSDEEYAQYAIPAYNCLAGRALFVVAGNPECAEELKAAGIENFIHVRVNQLETLKSFNQKLGI
ncbi:MAG: methylmalonyl-CoA mutase small subunit [Bacteroidales bacterium]|nr:methylmalonyl-CoA mutase small subunit [Bacteroidales bacterium]